MSRPLSMLRFVERPGRLALSLCVLPGLLATSADAAQRPKMVRPVAVEFDDGPMLAPPVNDDYENPHTIAPQPPAPTRTQRTPTPSPGQAAVNARMRSQSPGRMQNAPRGKAQARTQPSTKSSKQLPTQSQSADRSEPFETTRELETSDLPPRPQPPMLITEPEPTQPAAQSKTPVRKQPQANRNPMQRFQPKQQVNRQVTPQAPPQTPPEAPPTDEPSYGATPNPPSEFNQIPTVEEQPRRSMPSGQYLNPNVMRQRGMNAQQGMRSQKMPQGMSSSNAGQGMRAQNPQQMMRSSNGQQQQQQQQQRQQQQMQMHSSNNGQGMRQQMMPQNSASTAPRLLPNSNSQYNAIPMVEEAPPQPQTRPQQAPQQASQPSPSPRKTYNPFAGKFNRASTNGEGQNQGQSQSQESSPNTNETYSNNSAPAPKRWRWNPFAKAETPPQPQPQAPMPKATRNPDGVYHMDEASKLEEAPVYSEGPSLEPYTSGGNVSQRDYQLELSDQEAPQSRWWRWPWSK